MKLLKYGGFALVVLVVVGVCALAFLGMQSRSGAALGLFDVVLADCPSTPNCVSSETGTPDEKKVASLPLTAWAKLPTVIAEMGGNVTNREDAYLAVEFTSGFFGFVDDVEFRLTETDVQVRSSSRVGYSDRGVNSDRVVALREMLRN